MANVRWYLLDAAALDGDGVKSDALSLFETRHKAESGDGHELSVNYNKSKSLALVKVNGANQSWRDGDCAAYADYIRETYDHATHPQAQALIYADAWGAPASLALPWNLDAALADGAGTNTGTVLGDAPAYAYSLADEAQWDGGDRAKLLFDRASSYLAQGPSNTTNATNVRNWLAAFAAAGIMRLNADTIYVDGDVGDYYAARNWAGAMYAWAYLFTRGASVYSAADHTAIQGLLAGWLADIRWYYDPQNDTLGSKLNNHLGHALLCAALCAVAADDHEGLTWVASARRHLRTASRADPLKEDSVERPLWGYDPDPNNPLPERSVSMMDLDRAAGTTKHDGGNYWWWHASTAAVTDLILEADGHAAISETGTNFDWASMLAAYDATCADDGAALWAFIAANDVDNTATLASHLRISTLKVHADMAGLRYLTAVSGLSSATVDANLSGKTNRLLGGNIDLLRGYQT